MEDGKRIIEGKDAPRITDVATVKQTGKSRAVSNFVNPQAMFHEDGDISSGERPTRSEPVFAKRRCKKENKTVVLTPQGKKVLSCDVRLHPERIKQRRRVSDEKELSRAYFEKDAEEDEELHHLDRERKLLAEKIKKRKEIMKLQKELAEISDSNVTLGYQTRNYESTW